MGKTNKSMDELTQVSRSVLGKGDGFTMCALWKGKTLLRCLERPLEIRVIYEEEVETPDCSTLSYALRSGMNRSGSGMVLSPSSCHT